MRSLQIGRTRKATVTALAISEFVLNSSHFAGTIQQLPQIYCGLSQVNVILERRNMSTADTAFLCVLDHSDEQNLSKPWSVSKFYI